MVAAQSIFFDVGSLFLISYVLPAAFVGCLAYPLRAVSKWPGAGAGLSPALAIGLWFVPPGPGGRERFQYWRLPASGRVSSRRRVDVLLFARDVCQWRIDPCSPCRDEANENAGSKTCDHRICFCRSGWISVGIALVLFGPFD